MHSSLRVVVLSAFVVACGERGPKLPIPEVTTLPSGIVEVKNVGPSGWADTTGWKLVELYRVGGAEAEGTGAGELVDPQSVALDAAGGLYVADQNPAVIKQYGPGGAYVRSFGRDGSGPGEFRTAFIATGAEGLALHDPQSSRTSVFDSAGNFIRSWPSSCCYWSSIRVTRDGLIHVPTSGPRDRDGEPDDTHYIRYRWDGTVVDTMRILTPRPAGSDRYWTLSGGTGRNKMSIMMNIPLAPDATWSLDPVEGAVVSWTGDYRYVTTRTGLDTAQLVTLAASAATVSEDRRLHIRDSMIGLYAKRFDKDVIEDAFKLSDIPSTAPFFRAIEVDGRRYRWVRVDDGGNRQAARFDVFDSTGAYLGAVPLPRDFGLHWNTTWADDRVATITEDEEGLPVVVVYAIKR